MTDNERILNVIQRMADLQQQGFDTLFENHKSIHENQNKIVNILEGICENQVEFSKKVDNVENKLDKMEIKFDDNIKEIKDKLSKLDESLTEQSRKLFATNFIKEEVQKALGY